jgi:hypothetical protein
MGLEKLITKPIYYINELGYPDGINTFENHRLPQAYMDHMKMYSLSYNSFNTTVSGENNIMIFQTPTNNELPKLKSILPYLNKNKVFITQESNIFDWFDWPAEEQEIYINILSKCNGFLYHSEHDKNVMKIFCNNFVKYPGCTNMTIENPKSFDDGKYILIPNPIKRFQRGMISHKIATKTIKNIPIISIKYIPPKNYPLSFPDNYKLPGIEQVDRMPLNEWLGFIYSSKFGIDVHREFSGGNCSLEFGSLGVPLVGNINLDTQHDIFPDLSFEFNDYNSIEKAIYLLLNDKDFYNEVSLKALNNTKEKYNSGLIVNNFKNEINKFI